MERQSVLAEVPLHVVDVLRQCAFIAQEIHPLAFDDELGPIWPTHPKRNSALVILKFDLAPMGRKRVCEQLRNALIRQGFRHLSVFDDGDTMKKHVDLAGDDVDCATSARTGDQPCAWRQHVRPGGHSDPVSVTKLRFCEY